METMDTQTILNIILSIITVYLAARNFILTSRKDVQRESQEMAEIHAQLTQVMGLLRDLQRDVRTSTADFRALSDRVLIVETKLAALKETIIKMKEENDGK